MHRVIRDFVMLGAFRGTEAAQAAITRAVVFLCTSLDTNDIARRPVSRDLT